MEVIGDFAEVRRWYAARDAQRKADYKERYGYSHDYELVLNKLVPDLAAPAWYAHSSDSRLLVACLSHVLT